MGIGNDMFDWEWVGMGKAHLCYMYMYVISTFSQWYGVPVVDKQFELLAHIASTTDYCYRCRTFSGMCLYVCLFLYVGHTGEPCKMAEPIDMSFGRRTRLDLSSHILKRVHISAI